MRTFPPTFNFANSASETAPRFVIPITFDSNSPFFTSHAGIPSVPGDAIEGVIQAASALSQKIVPDEGRSEIGAMSFSVIDAGGAVTDALRARLTAGEGLRGKTAALLMGYSSADYSEYQVFQTQVIQGVKYRRGVYEFTCADITREQRKEIFDPKVTTLGATISATDATITVVSTADFQAVEHGLGWSDAPSTHAGYIQIQDEIIRWTGKTGTTFTGCTRGVLGTRAVPHTVDVSSANEDSRTKVTEVIYLEMPVPKLALAILTGEIFGTTATLPTHWHLGIDPEWIKEEDFTGIGVDLWNPANDAGSFIARFANLKKSDGKAFLEREVYQLAGIYPLVYSDGRLGIRRMNQILADAPYLLELNEDNVMSASELRYDMDRMSNSFRINWNHQKKGGSDEFTRSTLFVDPASIALHGKTATKTLEFRGLFGGRHTDSTVRTRINALRDRYSHPPALITLEIASHLNKLEVGDVVRVRLASVRDYVGNSVALDRSFEIQNKSTDYRSGSVSVELFGSTDRAGEVPVTPGQGGEGPGFANSLPDDWYSSEGTDLSTVLTITPVGDVGVIATGSHALVGDEDATNSDAIYYYLGDLELPNGATLNISKNVQLRVRGFFQVNGTINGVGGGRAGGEDTPDYGTAGVGDAGYLGNSRGMDGVIVMINRVGALFSTLEAPAATVGQVSAVPTFDLQVIPGSPYVLQGLPTDLRGTGGPPGGKYIAPQNTLVFAEGGTGGDGGAGLILIGRGMAVGLSGLIDLSGDDSATPSASATTTYGYIRPGAGGAGSPGALLLLLDGSELSVPDLGGRFIAATGHVGAPLTNYQVIPPGTQAAAVKAFFLQSANDPSNPGEGFETVPPSRMISDADLSNSAYRIQYVPAYQVPEEDQPVGAPDPTGLTATGIANGILLEFTLADFDLFDFVEVVAATSNDRTLSATVVQLKASAWVHPLASGQTRYYWIRTGKNSEQGVQYSDWYPASSTGGVSATST